MKPCCAIVQRIDVESLPSWERGLKHLVKVDEIRVCESLPSWERGLKRVEYWEEEAGVRSLPSWERGLKHQELPGTRLDHGVAPFVGAWIET